LGPLSCGAGGACNPPDQHIPGAPFPATRPTPTQSSLTLHPVSGPTLPWTGKGGQSTQLPAPVLVHSKGAHFGRRLGSGYIACHGLAHARTEGFIIIQSRVFRLRLQDVYETKSFSVCICPSLIIKLSGYRPNINNQRHSPFTISGQPSTVEAENLIGTLPCFYGSEVQLSRWARSKTLHVSR